MTKRARDPDIMTAEDVAAMLGIGRRQVFEAAARLEIPSRRVGRRLLFSRRAVEAWMHQPQKEHST